MASTPAQRDLADISDAEAQDLISSKLQALKTGTARLGLVASTNNQDEAQELLQAGIAAIKGRRKDAKAHEFVVPLTITQHLRPSQIDAIFTLVEAHAAACPGEDVDTSRVMLAIIAPDSTLVYYQISKGMVKPIN
uniref:tRNA-splicing endonuclease subunit Sen15 domain-containing protein n=1 Tax=Kalmanozyma brasiliensis (strain GHG001) TaxID=1365824 RepID=V5EUS8_KALBG